MRKKEKKATRRLDFFWNALNNDKLPIDKQSEGMHATVRVPNRQVNE